MPNLATLMTRHAAEAPDRPAIKLDDIVLSYGMLDEASARIAGLLAARGVAAGDRVGLILPNVPYFPVVLYGILRLGAVAVPMNPLLKGREVAFHLGDSGAKAVFGWHQFADAGRAGAVDAGAEFLPVAPGEFEGMLGGADPARDVVERAPDDTAVIIYTSGTTGTPKGAELTHHNLLDSAEVAFDLVETGPESVAFGALPLFHVFGMNSGLNSIFRAGGSMTLLPRFDPGKALEIIQRDRVDVFLGVPTMYAAMLHHPDHGAFDTSTLDLCVSGGAAMPVEVLRGFEAAFDCKVLEGYGLSETCAMATFNRPDRERKPGSIGTPVAGVDIRLVDEQDSDVPPGEVGELVIRSPHVMKGYFGRDDATAEAMRDGWFHTGDMATVDSDGYYYIVDRKKDMIIRGGYNVYPREIEEVLYEHPAIREAAVVGVPHESLGEEVAAVVALKPGADAGEEELRDFAKQRVAAYKYPRRVHIVDDLPKGPTGKILKREITL
ncbi:MAG TPA: long-chain fatty acid--CoA ligase [Solirubrobacteraceae bacterium]